MDYFVFISFINEYIFCLLEFQPLPIYRGFNFISEEDLLLFKGRLFCIFWFNWSLLIALSLPVKLLKLDIGDYWAQVLKILTGEVL